MATPNENENYCWITGRRVADGGTSHEHITHFEVTARAGHTWTDTKTATRIISKETACKWAADESNPKKFYVIGTEDETVQAVLRTRPLKVRGHKQAKYGSVKVSRWLQTLPDGYLDDNLMELKAI